MARFIDARIPVAFAISDTSAASHGPDTALLVEGDAAAPPGAATARFSLAGEAGHPVGCACCVPVSPIAIALNRLFVARAKGEVAFFTRVVAVVGPAGREALLEALDADALVFGRFRLDREGSPA